MGKKLLLLLLGIGIGVGITCHFLNLENEEPISEFAEEVNQITQIDYSERQEEVNRLVEKGKINIVYATAAVFDGKVSESFNVQNNINNHYPLVFEIFDESGNSIYKSKKIEPGYEINQIELEQELSIGTHDCKIKIGYAEEGNVSSVFPLSVEVK